MKRAVLLATVIAVAFVPAASASGKTKTKVTLDSVFTVPVKTLWDGDVLSRRKACEKQRQVFVYRELPEADELVGSTESYRGKTQRNRYYWHYEQDGVAPEGDYYAQVLPTDKCKGDLSETVPFP